MREGCSILMLGGIKENLVLGIKGNKKKGILNIIGDIQSLIEGNFNFGL